MRYWHLRLRCSAKAPAARALRTARAPIARDAALERSRLRRSVASSISAVVRARIRISPDMRAPRRHFSLPLPMKNRSASPKTRSQRVAALIAAAQWTAAQRKTARVDDVGAGTSGKVVRASETVMHDRCVQSLRERSRASRRQRALKLRATACHGLVPWCRMRSPTRTGSTSSPPHAATA